MGQIRPRLARWCGGLAFGLSLLGLAPNASAQTVTDERVWVNVMLQSRADRPSPWRWSVENILRTRDGVSAIDIAGLRPILNFAIDQHSTVGGGYAYVKYSPATDGPLEHRWFQHYIWTSEVAGGTLIIRERLEERVIEGNDRTALRLRQLIRFSHPVKTGSHVAIVGYDEFFLHLNTTTATWRGVDQNRAFVGVSDALNRSVRFEVGYVNQYGNGHFVADRMNHVLSGTLAFGF